MTRTSRRGRLWSFFQRLLGSAAASEPPDATIESASDQSLVQFPSAQGKAPCDIVLGLDFGTSCSKVVIRSPFAHGGRAVAVPFGDLAHRTSKFLLPTRIFVDEQKTISLRALEGAIARQDLKLALMNAADDGGNGQPPDIEALIPATAYLALALREARQWFLLTQAGVYGKNELRWQLNVGIPSAGYADHRVREQFRAAAVAAWVLSQQGPLLDASSVREGVTSALEGHLNPDVPTDVIPEVAAEVVGYARSPRRTEGLHVLVDVGASTLDICSFILRSEHGDDSYHLPTALVKRLGAHELHRYRISRLRDARVLDSRMRDDLEDPMLPVPETVETYLSTGGMPAKRWREIDEKFTRDCAEAVMRTLIDLWKKRDPHSERWRTGLPVFLAGGGSDMTFFQNVLRIADERTRDAGKKAGLKWGRLPNPATFDGDKPSDHEFHRLAVAFGLSFDSFNIGGIVPPGEIDDVPPVPRKNPYGHYIGPEQV